MVTTEERRTDEQTTARRRTRRIGTVIAIAAAAALAVAIAVAIAGGGNDESTAAPAPGTPDGVMADLIAAVQVSDSGQLPDLSAPLDPQGTAFLEWNLALGMDAVFSGCTLTPGDLTTGVLCQVTMGENYFFSRVAGTNLATSVSADVTNATGALIVSAWPPPTGLVTAEREYRTWIRTNHPALEDRMFGNDFAGIIRFSAEAGELHTEYADAYLTYLASADTPTWVMAQLIVAIEQSDPGRLTDVYWEAEPFGTRFLEWNLAAGMEPLFDNCEPVAGTLVTRVTCDVAMGENYFFSRIAGSNVATTVEVAIDNTTGALGVERWPPPDGLVEAETEFRTWIRTNHPELEDRMFGNDFAGILRFTNDAGELRTEHADAYLSYLASAGSPAGVMADLIAAVQSSDSSGLPDLAAPMNLVNTGFLEWNLALGMDPVFSDCTLTTGNLTTAVLCQVTMGEDYFFSRVAGTNVATTVTGSVTNATGNLTISGWPPPQGLLSAANDYRDWIRTNHPDVEDRMFGNDFAGILLFTEEAGELYSEYADAYLADLAAG